MCQTNASQMPPMPPLTGDNQSDFILGISSYLANKTNLKINISRIGKKKIVMKNVSEDDLLILPFLTNTNDSNKTIAMIRMSVFVSQNDGTLQNINIPGFSPTMIQLFNNSDYAAFLAGNRTHIPFKSSAFKSGNPKTVGEWVDLVSSTLPNVQTTTGKRKYYTIVLSDSAKRNAPGYSYCFSGYLRTPKGSCIPPYYLVV